MYILNILHTFNPLQYIWGWYFLVDLYFI